MLLPAGNPFKCHEEVLSLQLMIPPKGFDIFFPLIGGCSESLDAFRFLIQHNLATWYIFRDEVFGTKCYRVANGFFEAESLWRTF